MYFNYTSDKRKKKELQTRFVLILDHKNERIRQLNEPTIDNKETQFYAENVIYIYIYAEMFHEEDYYYYYDLSLSGMEKYLSYDLKSPVKTMTINSVRAFLNCVQFFKPNTQFLTRKKI